MGKPMVLGDDGTRRRLLEAIQAGVPLVHAATHAGIGKRTLFQTLARGEDAHERAEAGETLTNGDEIARSVWQEVAKARASVAVRNVALLQRSAQGGQLLERRTLPNGTVEEKYAPLEWRAAKYLLETSFPREFRASSQIEMEVMGQGGGPVQVESPSVVALAASLRERLAEDDDEDVVDGEVVERPALES